MTKVITTDARWTPTGNSVGQQQRAQHITNEAPASHRAHRAHRAAHTTDTVAHYARLMSLARAPRDLIHFDTTGERQAHLWPTSV